MLDLAFLILLIYIMIKANRGEVKENLCNIATVIGILAGIFGLIAAFLAKKSGPWLLHIAVMLMAFFIKRWAKKFAELYNRKIEEHLEEVRKMTERRRRDSDEKEVYNDDNFDDPNIRFGGGSGENWF